jgi:hypothetical protein
VVALARQLRVGPVCSYVIFYSSLRSLVPVPAAPDNVSFDSRREVDVVIGQGPFQVNPLVVSGAAPLDVEIAEARARRANLHLFLLFYDMPAPENMSRLS